MSVFWRWKIGYNIHEFAIKKKMITIAICDQVEQDRKVVAGFCQEYLKDKIVEYEIKEYTSGESLLVEVFPDVLFLNTKIKKIDGVLIKEVLYKMRANTKIIFISQELDRMIHAFGKNVYGFIEKPIEWSMFVEKMEVMINDILEERHSTYCKKGKDLRKLLWCDIVCIKAYGKYTKLFARDEEGYLLSEKSFCDWYLEVENSQFLCSHRSYLVNMFYVEQITAEIELMNGMKVPIAKDRRIEFFESYKRYVRSEEYGFKDRRLLGYVEKTV